MGNSTRKVPVRAGAFLHGCYNIIVRAEHIRNVSDYDDFYVADKEEARQQVENAGYMVEKIWDYMKPFLVSEGYKGTEK